MSEIARIRTRHLRRVAAAGLAAFVAIVVLEHFLQEGLDPASHQVSEYVHGSTGWLMTVGFLSWAVSLAATGLVVGRLRGGWPMRGALTMAAVGMLVTACFATETAAGRLPAGASLHAAGRLHDIGSGITALALLAASLLSLRVAPLRSIRAVTRTVVLGAVATDIALLAVGSDVGGIRQRALLAAGCLWQATVIAAGARGACERSRRQQS